MSEYAVIIKVKDGIVIDESNGATVCNVHSIGINYGMYSIDCLTSDGELLGYFPYARNQNSWIHCEYDNCTKDFNLATDGKIHKEVWKYRDMITGKTEKRIKEIKRIIKEFADQDQYSANNEYVKALYRELRELEGREQIEEEHYEPQFIGGSDVPIDGYYE